MGTTIVLIVAAGLVLFGISLYNGLVNKRNRVQNAFSQIDVQLTRRYDLIPNLVESVKGYMAHERDTLEAVINARNSALNGLKSAAADPSNAQLIKDLSAAEASLTGSLGKPTRICYAFRKN
jgi:LemA protein